MRAQHYNSRWIFFFGILALFGMVNIFLAAFLPSTAVAQGVETGGLVPCGRDDLNKDGMIKDVKNASGTIVFAEECKGKHFLELVIRITNFLIIIGAAFSAVAFGYAGFLMMTAAGEMGKIEQAKAIFGKVVIGFLLMLSAWIIVYAMESAFLNTTDSDANKKFKSFLQPSSTTP